MLPGPGCQIHALGVSTFTPAPLKLHCHCALGCLGHTVVRLNQGHIAWQAVAAVGALCVLTGTTPHRNSELPTSLHSLMSARRRKTGVRQWHSEPSQPTANISLCPCHPCSPPPQVSHSTPSTCRMPMPPPQKGEFSPSAHQI